MMKNSSSKTKNISLRHKKTIFDDLKNKLIELGMDYAKKNIENSKKEIANYIEDKIKSNLEKKVKKEIRKFTFLLSGIILLASGVLVFSYGLFDIIIVSYALPGYLTNIFYGLFLVIVGLILFLLYN